MLTVFSNFRIDNPERMLRMKASLASMREVSVQRWIINIRGSLAKEAQVFLNEELGDAAIVTTGESGHGWFADTRLMLAHINTPYLLYWIEDHICMVPCNIVDMVVADLCEKKIDVMMYSFFQFGNRNRLYNSIEKEKHGFIHYFNNTVETNDRMKIKWGGKSPYIISLCSIFSSKLFSKVVETGADSHRTWPSDTPFAAEKSPEDEQWLPIRTALPGFELFASIDDDHLTPGSCLQARGLYNTSVDRKALRSVEYGTGSGSATGLGGT